MVITFPEVLKRARSIGARCQTMVYWRWVRAGIVPKGQKIRGRGSLTFLDESVVFLVYAITVARAAGIRPTRVHASVLRALAEALSARVGGDYRKLPRPIKAAGAINDMIASNLEASWPAAVSEIPLRSQ